MTKLATITALRRQVAGTMAIALCSLPVIGGELVFPADCTPGHDCFVQQYPDMNPGPKAVDPFCGTATYDGHNGVDLRLLSMANVADGVPVLAMTDGRVLRWRDGEPDRLVLTTEDRANVEARECGNGVIIDHGETDCTTRVAGPERTFPGCRTIQVIPRLSDQNP